MASDQKRRESIDYLFNGNSVAIIGASADMVKLSARPLRTLKVMGFKGDVFAVNPRYQDLMGFPCVPGIEDLPAGVEAAMIMLPAPYVVQAARDCAAKDIRALVIAAQGFNEGTAEDKHFQQALKDVANSGVAICGPNTNGVANAQTGLALSFAPLLQKPDIIRPGSVSLISQSGSTSSNILFKLSEYGIGIAKTVTCGNELSISMSDYVSYCAADPQTDIILLFVETIRNPVGIRNALAACRAANKPVLAIKVGESEGGQLAARSHTGAIAGSYRNTLAFLRSEGVIVVDDLDALAAAALHIQTYGQAACRTGKLGVVTISGGFSALTADANGRLGHPLSAPSKAAVAALSKVTTKSAPINPYDIAGQNPIVEPVIDIFREDGFDQILFGLGFLYEEARKPMLEVLARERLRSGGQTFVVSPDLDPDDKKLLRDHSILAVSDQLPLLKALDAFSRTPPYERPVAPQTLRHAKLAGNASGLVDESESKKFLQQLGIKTPQSVIVPTAASELDIEALSRLARPLVLKGISDQIAHKSDHGLVVLNRCSDDEIRDAWRSLRARLDELDPGSAGILIEEMIGGGIEVFVGLHRDPVVGPVVVAGAGGVMVELLDDTVILVPPFSRERARSALVSTRVGRLLAGHRGAVYDIDAMLDVLLVASELAVTTPEIQSLDINPLLVLPKGQGAIAADGKIFVAAKNGLPDSCNKVNARWESLAG